MSNNILPPEEPKNEIQEFASSFGAFWKKNGNFIMITVTLVVVVFAGIRLYNTHISTKQETAWYELAATTNPRSFQDLGQTLPYAPTRAIANLKGADLMLEEALNPAEGEIGAQTPEEKLNTAAGMYQAVLDEDVHVVYKLNALMGLAMIAQDQNDLAKSEGYLKQIVEQAGDDYPTHAKAAESHLAMMDRLSKPIPLAPDREEPATEAPATPETDAPADGEPADAAADADAETAAPADTEPKDAAADQPAADAPAE